MKRILKTLAVAIAAIGNMPIAAAPVTAGPFNHIVTPSGTITAADKLAALKTAGINLPSLPPPSFVLTVAKPSTDYAFFYFFEPAELVTDYKLFYAILTSDNDLQSYAEIHWKSLPDTTYLVDCDLQSKSGVVRVDKVPGIQLTNGHLIVAKKSSPTAAYALDTFVQIYASDKSYATLRGCEITTVPTAKK